LINWSLFIKRAGRPPSKALQLSSLEVMNAWTVRTEKFIWYQYKHFSISQDYEKDFTTRSLCFNCKFEHF